MPLAGFAGIHHAQYSTHSQSDAKASAREMPCFAPPRMKLGCTLLYLVLTKIICRRGLLDCGPWPL